MPKEKAHDILIDNDVIIDFHKIISNGIGDTPPVDFNEAFKARKEIIEILEMHTARKERVKQRNKLVNFFIAFLVFQAVGLFGMLAYGTRQMTTGSITQEDFSVISSAFQVGIGAVALQTLGYLGIMVRYFFYNRK